MVDEDIEDGMPTVSPKRDVESDIRSLYARIPLPPNPVDKTFKTWLKNGKSFNPIKEQFEKKYAKEKPFAFILAIIISLISIWITKI